MIGPLLALLSSISLALKHVIVRRASLKIYDASFGTFVSVPTALMIILIILVINGQIQFFFNYSLESYIWFGLAGILQFAVGLSILYKCIQLMGANLAIVLSRINILVSVAIGIFFLKEPFSFDLLIGVLFIFIGITLPSLNAPMIRGAHGDLIKIPLKAYFLVVLTGFIFGITPIFIKIGIKHFEYPLLGAFISFLAGTFAISLLLLNKNNRDFALQINTKSFFLFFPAGIFFCISNILRFYALKMTSASIAVPLLSTMPIFLIFFSFIFNREVEIFNKKAVIGAISVVLGSILVF